jgi:Holliday junction resolvase RusA-like endonuclease
MNKQGREFIQYVRQCFEQQHGIIRPSKERMEMKVVFYFGNKIKRDLDNHAKIVQDGMNGFAFEDDSQIDILTLIRAYDKQNPRTEIIIKELPKPQTTLENAA